MKTFFQVKSKSATVKRSFFFLVLGGLTLGFLIFVLSRYQIDVVITPVDELGTDSQLDPETALPPPPTESAVVSPPTPGSPLWNPNPQSIGQPYTGLLRVSNQTQHPIRLVVLEYPSSPPQAGKRPAPPTTPMHWDFAPTEGSTQGLILSLPTGKVKVKPNDIVIAYAQDGSSLFWGPHIVGKTAQPLWNPRMQEWQFLVYP